ncbi:GNAT family N-acetyltransferase [Pseudoalteromonas arctica]|uniref:GNAT family N-acetyltransferase n=1 Tax=Pseudoalteromonas arctica TaxID=394751 RepID=A0A7Y0DWH2_9GAMM|nr:GNAT family N-acetyltransferase [Pseudoalteromonas arctica]NMM42798.1 GNAT family N-acetyltransferase [Pseudoalteromonas arctica]
MFKFFKSLFNSEKVEVEEVMESPIPEKPINGILLATEHDVDFIFQSVLNEAKVGHFNQDFLLPMTHTGLKKQIVDSIHTGYSPTASGVVPSKFYVYKKNNKQVGFYWVIEDSKNVFELYMISVVTSERKQGIGASLLSHAESEFIGFKVKARLYHPSNIMLAMLVKSGFKRGVKQGKNTIHLSKKC